MSVDHLKGNREHVIWRSETLNAPAPNHHDQSPESKATSSIILPTESVDFNVWSDVSKCLKYYVLCCALQRYQVYRPHNHQPHIYANHVDMRAY